MTSASSFSESVVDPSFNLCISIGSVDFSMDNSQAEQSMASNGLSGPPIAQNGAVRLPEGSLPDDAPANMSTQNTKMSRKRTKTGCLTCRKRRIKCGEERPICGNCVKSKRNCEGYNQRVIFKDPMNALRPTGSATQHPLGNGPSFDHLAMQGGPVSQYARVQSSSNSSQAPLPAIRPKPSYLSGQNRLDGVHVAATYSGAPNYAYKGFDPTQFIPPYSSDDQSPRQRQPYDVRHALTDKIRLTPEEYNLAHSLPGHGLKARFQHTTNRQEDVNGPRRSNNQQPTDISSEPEGPNCGTDMPYGTSLQNHVNQVGQSGDRTIPSNLNNNSPDGAYYYQQNCDPRRTALQRTSLQGNEWIFVDPESKTPDFSAQSVLQRSMENGWLVNHDRKSTIDARSLVNGYDQNGVPQQYYLDQKADLGTPSIPYSQTMLLEDPDDDYYDDDSDGDPEVCIQNANGTSNHQSDLGVMLALSAGQEDGRLRSFTAFLNEPNVLATYRPTATASPLMDPQTARVFCHFVTSTGPSLSIFERHPTNPSVMFTGSPVPPSQQALWTYTLPTLALNHQGLLHSMLALASLHIAKLQHTSPTPSLKHYHYALRRVAKAVGLPSRRHEIATFAASLLLGFYEVMTAEHSKWNSHLAGARQLAMEIDFADMTRRIKAMRVQSALDPKFQYHDGVNGSIQLEHCNNFNYSDFNYSEFNYSDDLLLRHGKDVDEDLVSTFMGWKICYGELPRVIDDAGPADLGREPLTAKDLENYRIQCDLFWWYCKQDVYQSIVSQNCLLMPYDRWGHCPPRAPMGRLDAIYGTMDHLILLMGRIADFAGRDQVRKREALKANGGVWMPRPGMFPPGMFSGPPPAAPQSASAGRSSGQPTMGLGDPVNHAQPTTGPSTSSQYPPPMPGMTPSLGPQRMPEGFIQSPDTSRAGIPQRQGFELDAASVTAEAEWEDIKNAFEVFEQRLGPDFQPLSPEYMQPLSTPFGPALYYRTYSMSCIWALYYTGRIITARVHPSMPPAAMVAAGVAAFQTKGWAKMIGRVCAGLQPTNSSTTTELNPSLGAALIESSLCLFFAGIQYQDAGQRGWTITKLRDVARLTGWQSSAAIASGCETAWTKAAEAGKGPPYQRTMDPMAKDDRVAGRRPDLSGGPPRDNNDRRFITINAGARVHWALGLLSVEEDMQRLNLER